MKREIICPKCSDDTMRIFAPTFIRLKCLGEHVRWRTGIARDEFRCDGCGSNIGPGELCVAFSVYTQDRPFSEWEDQYLRKMNPPIEIPDSKEVTKLPDVQTLFLNSEYSLIGEVFEWLKTFSPAIVPLGIQVTLNDRPTVRTIHVRLEDLRRMFEAPDKVEYRAGYRHVYCNRDGNVYTACERETDRPEKEPKI